MKLLMTTVALATLISSAALAYEDPECRIGDRYPLLDQSSRMVAARNIGGPYVPARGLPSLNQPMTEDVEARIGDKYPLIEQTNPPYSAARVVTSRAAMQQSARVYYEDPESRIGDRYPSLAVAPQREFGYTRVARVRQARRGI